MGLADLEQFEDLNCVRLNAIRWVAVSGLHLEFLKAPSSASWSEAFIWDFLRPIADARSAGLGGGDAAVPVFRFALENQVNCSKAIIGLYHCVIGLAYAELAGYDLWCARAALKASKGL